MVHARAPMANGLPVLNGDDEPPRERSLERDEAEKDGDTGQAVVFAFANHGRVPPDSEVISFC